MYVKDFRVCVEQIFSVERSQSDVKQNYLTGECKLIEICYGLNFGLSLSYTGHFYLSTPGLDIKTHIE